MIPCRRKKPLPLVLTAVLSLKAAVHDVHAGENRYAAGLEERGISGFEPAITQNDQTAQSVLDFRYYFTVSSDLPVKMMFHTPVPSAKTEDYSEYEAPGGAVPRLKAFTALSRDFTGADGVSRLSANTDITQPEKEALLLEIRGLINNARETYFAGNFEAAETMLVQARGRSLTIGDGEDAEITYWLTLVRGALSLRSYRDLPITAPLYAEMSQLLSDAKRSYDEGLRFINSNQRNVGLVKLTEARKKTREVKLLFPINEEADFLELRIDRIIDPDTFDRSFRRRLSQAVAGIKERSLRAFEDLKNLAAIDPRYPGMGDILEQAEITMGYRSPPADPQDPAESDELTGIIVLDSSAERDYQRAVQALQRGNPITALSIVEQLLRNPRYRDVSKILELRRRIELVL
ncbi:MAG: hypothetical protein LBG08_05860 [Spirochaetaceae bacterium]|jgi:hypothetical protein|nr:hypothetical protein [Spirochaetaceae bacterium]